MPYDAWATIVAALIGAVIGSLGAALAAHLLERSSEKARTRSELAQRYLFQVQDSVESLWFRLENLEDRDGGDNMPEDYYVTTMLYAVGRVLACERLLALEGAYFTIEAAFPQLGEFLKGKRIDHRLSGIRFFHYNRLALAEAMLRWEGGQFRPATYLEFRERYESPDSPEGKWLAPARQAILRLRDDSSKREELLTSLEEFAHELEDVTDLKTSVGS